MDKIDRNDLKALMKLKGYPFMEDIVINKVNILIDNQEKIVKRLNKNEKYIVKILNSYGDK